MATRSLMRLALEDLGSDERSVAVVAAVNGLEFHEPGVEVYCFTFG